MAGARPSSFKAGGGFLNNVDGVIVNYEFTTEFPGSSGRASKKKSDFSPLYCVLSAQIDGADDPAVRRDRDDARGDPFQHVIATVEGHECMASGVTRGQRLCDASGHRPPWGKRA